LKVQYLQKKVEDLRQQSSVVDHYEAEVSKLRDQEKNYLEAMETLQHEIEKLETALADEKAKEKSMAATFNDNEGDLSAFSNKRVAGMYSLILHLRNENRELKKARVMMQYKHLFADPFDPVTVRANELKHSNDSVKSKVLQELKSVRSVNNYHNNLFVPYKSEESSNNSLIFRIC
jgi:chromosome segregation ATPase